TRATPEKKFAWGANLMMAGPNHNHVRDRLRVPESLASWTAVGPTAARPNSRRGRELKSSTRRAVQSAAAEPAVVRSPEIGVVLRLPPHSKMTRRLPRMARTVLSFTKLKSRYAQSST